MAVCECACPCHIGPDLVHEVAGILCCDNARLYDWNSEVGPIATGPVTMRRVQLVQSLPIDSNRVRTPPTLRGMLGRYGATILGDT